MTDSELLSIFCRALQHILSPHILAFQQHRFGEPFTLRMNHHSEYDPGLHGCQRRHHYTTANINQSNKTKDGFNYSKQLQTYKANQHFLFALPSFNILKNISVDNMKLMWHWLRFFMKSNSIILTILICKRINSGQSVTCISCQCPNNLYSCHCNWR